jgi:hypothetical protein
MTTNLWVQQVNIIIASKNLLIYELIKTAQNDESPCSDRFITS